MTTLHILCSPHSPVHIDNKIDAFSIITLKFIRNMSKKGYNCISYTTVGSNTDCENVICLDKFHQDSQQNISLYNEQASVEIQRRKKPGDLILCFYGWENRTAANANNDLKILEPSIGYSPSAVFAPYRIFTSYSQMHYFYGQQSALLDPSWSDEVIYNPISEEEFCYTINKQDYVLFFGRVSESKGLDLAVRATEIAGKKLVVAGPGNFESLGYNRVPSHVNLVGPCNLLQRKTLMANAMAIIGPTKYLEPFGNMIPEGYMSGTPAITTDWGAFAETVVNGVTGFRCRSIDEFANAIDKVKYLNPADCKHWALKHCEDSVVYRKYHNYLEKLIHDKFHK